ncbi:MAG: DUF2110 family protein [Candidatus Bathyarchaeota archaeon]|nr:DUF2110 family protein [Candidatus Bathyarchaeota archaeon]
MSMLTLLAKVYAASQLKQIDETLKRTFEGVAVETKILGAIADGWVQIEVAGEDAKIATNYLIKEIGICPRHIGHIKKSAVMKGYISNFETTGEELLIDIGVFEPAIVPAVVPLHRLQLQLADGRPLTLGEISELFGFCKGLPVNVKILKVSQNRIEAELSNKQISDYTLWRDSLLDRLIIMGASLNEIKATLAHTKLYRDIIDVEPLGLLAHSLICKFGTDAAGLIPLIGRFLKHASFSIFNAKRNYELLKI